ncbi:hypothetical protein HYALB_00011924 [Hymenoscyphus albidus]|uniref:chitinase n=1 Tax=Hymenoscyphus albidus TaxID=595503 RepID=A0A9N9LTC2_9HELO|nr:hypothetical protein HYALB_00011924 [Hymenoscyphus albidus]
MSYYGPTPPPIPYDTRPEMRRPSQPSLDASLQSLTRKNAVYYPNYRVYRGETPATLNYHCINHVFYAFAQVSPDGIVSLNDEWADAQMPVDGATGCIGSFMRLKQEHEYLRVILSIGGGAASQNFARFKHPGLTESIASYLVDWEHPSDQIEGQNFLSLLAAIRLYLPDNQYLLTAALPAGQWALQNINLYKAQDYLDLLNLMAYDFTGSWSEKAGHHAQLYAGKPGEPSSAAAVDYVISTGFPAAKILLGVPVYGRSFLGTSGPEHSFTGHGGEEGTFEYKYLPCAGTEEIVNTRVVGAFCHGGDGEGGWVTYDNPETVKMKAGFCNQRGLGGLFYWTGTADVPSGPRSLVSAGFKALHGS